MKFAPPLRYRLPNGLRLRVHPMPATTPPTGPPLASNWADAPLQRSAQDRRRIESQALFGDQIEVEIEHRSQVYRLRQTALGKLILTK